ncbi:MAG: LysR family transcriptional regulator [Treponemataceae bacterium]|nr:LysR family transcriptional regulator [Treponemataceae bacterium]
MYSHELVTLITVADKGSFLKASEALYTTPASVMNQINKLEGNVGVKLFERTNQGTRLTTAGRAFYEDAKRLISFAEAAVKRARQLAVPGQKVIRVGTSILRPCKRLIEWWNAIDDGSLPYQIDIVPFDDDPKSLNAVIASLGNNIDCFIGPCDSIEWRANYNILQFDKIPCRIAVPRKHRLAKKSRLRWSDLDGETLMLVKRGNSAVLDSMRDDILKNHPSVTIADADNFYDTSVFNECERMNCLMETLDIWKDVHPALLTLPVEWNYEVPYGVIYAKKPAPLVVEFIGIIQKSTC